MKTFLSTTDLAIWAVLIAGKLFLCLCLFKRRVPQRLPWFSAYVLVSTLKSLLLLLFAFSASYSVYYRTFFWTSHAVSILAFLTLIEFARNVLPGLDLPRRKVALTWVLGFLFAILALAVLTPLQLLENRFEVGGYLTIAAVFIVTAVYSRSLGLRWSRLLGGISFTLGALYFADGVAKALMAYYSYPSFIWIATRQLSELTSLLAVISWIVVLLSPWGEYDLSDEELKQLESVMDKIEDDFRKLFSGGAR